jgi:Mlc titration factor MtfA (ptsG expression regulator)
VIAAWWRRKRDRDALRERAIPDDLWLETLGDFPFLKYRPLPDLLKLRELATLFLARKEFATAGGLALTDRIALAVAAQACVPILHLGLDWYDGFVGIVLHPGEVVAQREWTDDDGIVHTGEEVLAGEAMPGGPVMLSWSDVQAAGSTAAAGYNVVIHEFVHVLDMRDGPADGVPPLATAAQRQRWIDVMSRSHAEFCKQLQDGRDTLLDPYAANGLEEFFPVCAEAFFVAPAALHSEHREVYGLMREFFQQDPIRLAR